MKIIRVGIDFGTTYSFIGFEHGDKVMPLIPSKETYGIPSIFYYDGKNKLVGRMAERRSGKHPEYTIRSIKRKLRENIFDIGGKQFTSKEIVKEIFSYIIQSAEEQLSSVYLEEYDEMEAVITVPVDFSEPMKNLIKEAAGEIVLKNGKKLKINGLIPEPIAASIEYFGLKKEKDARILVYDLGGGTFDVAIVQAHAADTEIPYEIISQEGDKSLGGDDWDRELANWIEKQYEENFGEKATNKLRETFLIEARKIKEELTEMEEVDTDIPIKGDYLEISITRAEFEKMTEKLLQRTMKKIHLLMSQQKEKKIDHVILTGGSTYMPQIRRALEQSNLFEKETDILFVEPEHAIAYGAARYAKTKRGDVTVPLIKLKATHGYGILYWFENDEEQKELIKILIPKGAELPYLQSTTSVTRVENQIISTYTVYESEYNGKEFDLIEPQNGNKIMQTRLERKEKIIPKGTRTTDTLSLSEDGILHFKSIDHMSGIEVENSIVVDRII